MKNTSEQTASGQPEGEDLTSTLLEGDELMKLDGDLTSSVVPSTVEEDEKEGDAEDSEWVVVSKGNTLYHNGEKYPQFQRLKMDAADAAPLLKNGVIVAYSDLLKQVSHNGG